MIATGFTNTRFATIVGVVGSLNTRWIAIDQLADAGPAVAIPLIPENAGSRIRSLGHAIKFEIEFLAGALVFGPTTIAFLFGFAMPIKGPADIGFDGRLAPAIRIRRA